MATELGDGEVTMNQRYEFRIKTKTGGEVGGIVFRARDQYEAQNMLMKQYPNCTILNCRVSS